MGRVVVEVSGVLFTLRVSRILFIGEASVMKMLLVRICIVVSKFFSERFIW